MLKVNLFGAPPIGEPVEHHLDDFRVGACDRGHPLIVNLDVGRNNGGRHGDSPL
jgi:hypothetical protein